MRVSNILEIVEVLESIADNISLIYTLAINY